MFLLAKVPSLLRRILLSSNVLPMLVFLFVWLITV